MKDIEQFRKEFQLEHATHVPLNNAGLALMPKKTSEKMKQLIDLTAAEGAYSAPLIFKEWIDSKRTLAKFIGAKENEIAWTSNCSAAISFIANGYDEQGDEEIIIFENDYPANFYPWVDRAKRTGAELKIIKAEKDLTRPLDKVITQISDKTTIVALSHIQSDCGYLMDISEVAEAVHKVGAILVVDAIQSTGVCPIDFQSSGADVLCSGTQKWICGPMGAGFLAVRENLMSKISPSLHGALNYGTYEEEPRVEKKCFPDGRKFEQGTPSLYSLLGAAESMELLMEYSVDNLWKKSLELREQFKNEFKELGFTIFGGENTGPQISVNNNRVDLKTISDALNAARISHALRPAPIDRGRVLRLSPHAYNTKDEVNQTMEVIKKTVGKAYVGH